MTWSLIYRSVSTALSLLSLAHMYMVPDLVSPVLQYLIHNTSEDSVLLVLQDVLLYHRYKAILYLIHNTREDSVLQVLQGVLLYHRE